MGASSSSSSAFETQSALEKTYFSKRPKAAAAGSDWNATMLDHDDWNATQVGGNDGFNLGNGVRGGAPVCCHFLSPAWWGWGQTQDKSDQNAFGDPLASAMMSSNAPGSAMNSAFGSTGAYGPGRTMYCKDGWQRLQHRTDV